MFVSPVVSGCLEVLISVVYYYTISHFGDTDALENIVWTLYVGTFSQNLVYISNLFVLGRGHLQRYHGILSAKFLRIPDLDMFVFCSLTPNSYRIDLPS